jgi:multicomponent Na+:H+ antiporter subunit D
MLFALTGSLDLLDVAARLGAAPAFPVTVALGLLATSFLVKAALFPLHVWLPDAHAIAPSPVSAVLSGLVVKVGILGLLRLVQLGTAAENVDLAGFHLVLTVLGSVSILMGAFLAMFQDDVKLMLAYSTISNVGYIVLGLGLATPFAVIGGAVHVFNHALIKTALFLAAGTLIHATGLRTLGDLQGVARTMPSSAAALAIGAVSIVGIPPTAGFICKWYIALGAFEAGRGAFGVVLVFGALFIFIYFVRMVNALYFRAPVRPEVASAREVPWSMRGPVLILAALCLLMGVLASLPIDVVEPTVLQMLPGGGP